MNDAVRDLYQEVIIEHGRRPRNFGKLDAPSCCAQGKNPLCGDEIHVYCLIDNNHIQDLKFDGQGCAICTASASLMTEQVLGKSIDEAQQFFQWFHDLLTNQEVDVDEKALGKLMILSGVKKYPARVKCATLAWHTLKNALDHSDYIATTE